MDSLVHRFKVHGSLWLPWHTLFLSVLCAGVYVMAGPAVPSLVFHTTAIAEGQIWRLVTGHWVHGDVMHLAWNLVAFVILGWLLERTRGPGLLYSALLVGALGVSAGVWLLPGLDYYCGLSGILNTLMYFILIDGWIKHSNGLYALLLTGASAKIAYEIQSSTAVFTDTAWPAVPEAHLAGAVAGLVIMAGLVLHQMIAPARLIKTSRLHENE